MSARTAKLLGALVMIAAVVIGWWVWPGSSDGAGPAAQESGGPASRRAEQVDDRTPKLERASISGAVLRRDELGKAVAVAVARVCVWAIDEQTQRVVELASGRCVTTGADGRYRVGELEPGRYRVTAQAPALLPEVWTDVEQDEHRYLDLGVGEAKTGIDFSLVKGGLPLSGTVVDVSGGPIEGAIVVASGPGVFGPDAIANAISDERGRFSMLVRGGEYRLRAEALGYAPTYRAARAPHESVELRLTPESVLIGRVVDEAGDAVAGVEVTASPGLSFPMVISDEQGRFRLGGLPPGIYQPEAIGERVYGQVASPLYVGLGQTSEPIVLRVHPAYQVRGQIVALDIRSDEETGCAGGRVDLRGGGFARHGRADDEGAVVLDGVPGGRHELSVYCPDAIDRLDIKLEVNADVDDQRWIVDVGGFHVSGRVVDASGRGVDDVFVVPAGPGDAERRLSGTDGEFELLVHEPGTYTLAAKLRGQQQPSATQELEVSDDVEGVELVVGEVASMRGHVVDHEGQPVPGIPVALCDARARCYHRATSDGDGDFGFDGLAIGSKWVALSKDVHGPGTDIESVGEPVEIVADRVAEVTLVTEVGEGSIRGTVTSEGGPAADAWVVAGRGGMDELVHDWEIGPVLCDVDGSFTLEGLGEGTWAVRAFRREGGEASVAGVELGSTISLDLAATASVAGRVHKVDGSAPAHFEIVANSGDDRRRKAQFYRSEGAFELVELPAGEWGLEITSDSGVATLSVELSAGQRVDDLDVELEPRVTIRGRALDSRTGEPVTGVQISYNSGSAFKTNATPGKDGRFELSGLPPGRVRLHVVPRNWGSGAYRWQFPFVDIEPEPSLQDIGDLPLAGSNLERGETAGDLGFEIAIRGHSEDGATVDEQFVEVTKVRPGGPAANAGLRVGDVLTSFDGFSVEARKAEHVHAYMRVAVGKAIVLGRRDAAEVTIVAAPPSEP